MDSSYNSPTTKIIYRITQVVWYLLGLIEALLAFRFVLKFLGANPAAVFTKFIYQITESLVYPFISVFNTSKVQGSTFEWATLLAMFVYVLIAFAVVRLFLITKTVSTPEAAQKLDKEENQQNY